MATKRRFAQPKSDISIDKAALDEQVREKRDIRAAEKEADSFYSQQALDNDRLAVFLEKECLKEKRTTGRELARTLLSMNQQRVDEKKAAEKRMVEELGAAGVASLQVFVGEDPDHSGRKKTQAEQMKRWANQQVAEKTIKKKQELAMDRLTAERVEEVTHKAHTIEQSIKQKRREQAIANAEFNKQLHDMKDSARLISKKHEQSCNMQEIQNMLDSDILNGRHVEGTLGKRGGRGGPPPTFADIQEEQAQQRDDIAHRKQLEKEQQMAEDRLEESRRRVAVTLERNRARQRRERVRQIGEDRREQVEEAAAHKAAEQEMLRAEEMRRSASGAAQSIPWG